MMWSCIGWTVEPLHGDPAQEHTQPTGVHGDRTDRKGPPANNIRRRHASRLARRLSAISLFPYSLPFRRTRLNYLFIYINILWQCADDLPGQTCECMYRRWSILTCSSLLQCPVCMCVCACVRAYVFVLDDNNGRLLVPGCLIRRPSRWWHRDGITSARH